MRFVLSSWEIYVLAGLVSEENGSRLSDDEAVSLMFKSSTRILDRERRSSNIVGLCFSNCCLRSVWISISENSFLLGESASREIEMISCLESTSLAISCVYFIAFRSKRSRTTVRRGLPCWGVSGIPSSLFSSSTSHMGTFGGGCCASRIFEIKFERRKILVWREIKWIHSYFKECSRLALVDIEFFCRHWYLWVERDRLETCEGLMSLYLWGSRRGRRQRGFLRVVEV